MDRKLLPSTSNSSSSIQKDIGSPEVLVDNWTYWIAREFLISLQSATTVSINLEDLLTVLDLRGDHGFEGLFNDLAEKKEEVQSQFYTLERINDIKDNLEIYYDDFIALKVEKLSQQIQSESVELLNKLIKIEFDKASPEKLMPFIKELSKELLYIRRDLEKEKKWHSERKKSAWKAFYKLCEIEDTLKKNTVWNAVFLALKSKLEIEKCDAFRYIIIELIKLCQSYYDHVNRSQIMLENIKISLENKSSLNIIVSLPVFSKLEKINYEQEKRLLEVWNGGHKLNYWGSSPVSWQQVESKMLSNLKPIILSIFAEFQASFVQYLKTEDL